MNNTTQLLFKEYTRVSKNERKLLDCLEELVEKMQAPTPENIKLLTIINKCVKSLTLGEISE